MKKGTREYDAIICSGAVRSGKTTCLALGFFCWAMSCFSERNFALCARSVGAARRNILSGTLPLLTRLGMVWREEVSRNRLVVETGGGRNYFYLFGGCNEASGAGIQGMTLAGALLDEVTLMPESFVEQTAARCSVEGSRLWFSCNPEGPGHWFYREWILKAEEKRALYVTFSMEDNPGLSKGMLERYRRMFQGSFYRRFVLGEWTGGEGLVYGFFHEGFVKEVPPGPFEKWRVSCDYGTVNPCSFGLWGLKEGIWYRVEEYYYDSKRAGRQKTDGEYEEDLARLAAGRVIDEVIVDPSAASFLTLLRQKGWRVRKADNDVLEGIRVTADLLRQGRLVICRGCRDALREIGLYRWDSGGGDKVKKEFDHAMDEIRYFAARIAAEKAGTAWSAGSVERRAPM